jgi:hypothetical protein
VGFTGLPPFFFFFSKLGLLIYVLQMTSFFNALFLLLFLALGWYFYFVGVRWLSLIQAAIGYSRVLVLGLFSAKLVQIWVCVFLVYLGLACLLDDFSLLVSWVFF